MIYLFFFLSLVNQVDLSDHCHAKFKKDSVSIHYDVRF